MIQFTIFTSTRPQQLTKTFGLAKDGSLTKTTVAQMAEGSAERADAADLHALSARLDALTSAQAVGWGVGKGRAAADRVQIITQEAERAKGGAGASRSRENFEFAKGPGVLLLDHDGAPGEPLDADALRAKLIEVCPPLAAAPMLVRASTSAGLCAPGGRELTGLRKWHAYIPVKDASKIPAAGKHLEKLLWAGGLGWHEVGNAGQALARGLVDGAVWQPERLDFAAAPVLRDGVQRSVPAACIYGDATALFDLDEVLQLPLDESAAKKAQRESREAIRGECTARREAWAAQRAPELAKVRNLTLEKARDVLIRASEHAVLMGDFILTTSEGKQVTVGEVLDNAKKWHGARFADPLDPDHDLRVARVNLQSGGRPYLWSHRHGGMRFELLRQSSRIQVGRGMRINTTDSTLQVLRERGELFDFGEGAVAYVAGGRARTVSQDWLTDHMGRVIDFYEVRTRKAPDGSTESFELADDAPPAVARAIMAKHGEREFKQLLAVVTAPTLRADGSVLDVPGYDEASRLMYFCEDTAPPRVPESPTPADALAALNVLWERFAQFPLVDDVARGVVLHGLLTAAIRAALPTAPGIALDAPAAGTGKTLLARCIGILATGSEPATLPPADTDEETRKRLFAALREGQRVLLWDNVREPLGCAALDSFLTASTFADRILGSSETAALPNRALFVATGNNLRLTGDTCRRIFLARLDAQSEQPYARDFDFDPAQRIEAERARYVVAALTIIRAHIAAGSPKLGKGRTASFERWDDLVRQPICWLRSLIAAEPGTGLPGLDDPLKAAQLAFEADPETTKHTALLHAWFAAFSEKPTTVATAAKLADEGMDEQLRAALSEIAGQGAKTNTRMVGRWIERMVGRRVAESRDDQRIGELWFEKGRMAQGLVTWVVRRRRAPVTENKPTKDTKPTQHLTASGIRDSLQGGFGGYGGFVSPYGGVTRSVQEVEDDFADLV